MSPAALCVLPGYFGSLLFGTPPRESATESSLPTRCPSTLCTQGGHGERGATGSLPMTAFRSTDPALHLASAGHDAGDRVSPCEDRTGWCRRHRTGVVSCSGTLMFTHHTASFTLIILYPLPWTAPPNGVSLRTSARAQPNHNF